MKSAASPDSHHPYYYYPVAGLNRRHAGWYLTHCLQVGQPVWALIKTASMDSRSVGYGQRARVDIAALSG